MLRYIEVDKNNLKEYLEKYNVLICKIRNSRIKAKQLAILEIVMQMYDKDVMYIKNGPLGDVKGIISFFVDKRFWEDVCNRLQYLGYTNRFYTILIQENESINYTDLVTINKLSWKSLDYSLYNLFTQDEEVYESQSPHKRKFKIISFDETVKTLEGYRGDGTELGRRALPVEDARCMVNLSNPFSNKDVLDCFGGGGGIVYMYKYLNSNINMSSIDIDYRLKPGLEFYGSKHYTADASKIGLENTFDSIVTEVPFSENITEKVNEVLSNVLQKLSNSGILVLMCGIEQSEKISKHLEVMLKNIFSKQLNRKGTDVSIQVWTKNKELAENLKEFAEVLKKVY